MAENDRLGQLGEIEFHRVCERLELFWSKLEPDRTGKDCIVEWPPVEALTLDTRPGPRRCHVQVKATKLESKAVRLKLSAAEWLVKDLSPSFVVVPIFNADDQLDHWVCFHVSKQIIARVLTKLRVAEKDEKNTTRQWISLSLSSGTVCENDRAVRTFLEIESGANMVDYASSKEQLLKTLGYEELFEAEYKVQITANSMSEIVECFLGERSLSAKFGLPERTRFGIKLPESGEFAFPGTGLLSVDPNPTEKWQLIAVSRENQDLVQIDVRGMSFAIEGLPHEYWRAKATNGLIDLSISGTTSSCTFNSEGLEKERFEIGVLIDSIRFWRAIACDRAKIKVLKNGMQPALSLPYDVVSNGHEEWTSNVLELLEYVQAIYAYCDVELAEVNLPQLFDRRSEIKDAAMRIDLRQYPNCPIRIRGEPNSIVELEFKFRNSEPFLLMFPVILAGDILAVAIAYSVTAERLEDELLLRVSSRFPIRSMRLGGQNPVADYHDFVSKVREDVTPAFQLFHDLVAEDNA